MAAARPLRLSLAVGLLGGVAQALSTNGMFDCLCLNWKRAYESKKVSCGDGLETFTYSGAIGKHMETRRFCEGHSVYSKQDSIYCTKVAQGSALPNEPKNWTEGAWCYVSSKCKELNGGAQVNEEVSWKSCVRGKDAFLADLEPPHILKVALGSGLNPTTLAQMGLPIYRDLTWGEAREVWRRSSEPTKLSEEQKNNVMNVLNTPRSTIFCTSPPPEGSPDACGPGEVWVVYGHEVWRMGTMQCLIGSRGCTMTTI